MGHYFLRKKRCKGDNYVKDWSKSAFPVCYNAWLKSSTIYVDIDDNDDYYYYYYHYYHYFIIYFNIKYFYLNIILARQFTEQSQKNYSATALTLFEGLDGV